MPKTKCVWTSGHCCDGGVKWNEGYGCQETVDLCYSFWPTNKEEGKGAKYTETPKKVCYNIGSVAYGFWVKG